MFLEHLRPAGGTGAAAGQDSGDGSAGTAARASAARQQQWLAAAADSPLELVPPPETPVLRLNSDWDFKRHQQEPSDEVAVFAEPPAGAFHSRPPYAVHASASTQQPDDVAVSASDPSSGPAQHAQQHPSLQIPTPLGSPAAGAPLSPTPPCAQPAEAAAAFRRASKLVEQSLMYGWRPEDSVPPGAEPPAQPLPPRDRQPERQDSSSAGAGGQGVRGRVKRLWQRALGRPQKA